MSGSRNEELIRLVQSGDSLAAEQMITENSGLIWSVVKRYFGRGVDSDDLYQLGCLGFIKAMHGFDPEYGTKFSTYAVPKILGEIRRFLRDDGAIKVSRSIKERALVIRNAAVELEQTLGRQPTLTEINAATGISVEDIAMTENAMAATESIQKDTGEDGLTLEGVLGDYEYEEKLIENVTLREAIAKLPEMEREVVRLRFYRGMTQSASARVLKVSQVQISRVERRAVERLRQYLE